MDVTTIRIRYEAGDERVAVVTPNRPERHNPLPDGREAFASGRRITPRVRRGVV